MNRNVVVGILGILIVLFLPGFGHTEHAAEKVFELKAVHQVVLADQTVFRQTVQCKR